MSDIIFTSKFKDLKIENNQKDNSDEINQIDSLLNSNANDREMTFEGSNLSIPY